MSIFDFNIFEGFNWDNIDWSGLAEELPTPDKPVSTTPAAGEPTGGDVFNPLRPSVPYNPPAPPSTSTTTTTATTTGDKTGGDDKKDSWPKYDIIKGIMVNEDGTAYIPPARTTTTTTLTTAGDVGLKFGVGAEIPPPEDQAARNAGLVFGAGGSSTPTTIEPVSPEAGNAGLIFGAGGPGSITGLPPKGTGNKTGGGYTPDSDGGGEVPPSEDQAARNAGLIFGAGGVGSITGTPVTTPPPTPPAPPPPPGPPAPPAPPEPPTPPTPPTPPAPPTPPTDITTNISVLKALLRGMGFNSAIIDSSTSFLLDLLKDGLDYDNAVSIFLNSKDYTTKEGKTISSPFYAEYGKYNEGLIKPKTAAELYNAVEGYKEVVDKYQLNNKFVSEDYLKKYIKNNVTVAQLDERANTGRLKAVNADPAYLESLKQLGYISGSADLTDFFMDPTVGQETLEQKRATSAFATEAIRRAQRGIQFSGERFSKAAAGLLNLGLSEAQIGVRAAEGFENIAEQLLPTQKLASIWEKLPATEMQTIQQELEAEQFGGTASQRRKKLAELEQAAFMGQTGVGAYSLRTASPRGLI